MGIDVAFVALGGGLGAACRYLVSLIPVRGDFPVLTLLTNLLGALLIGFIVGSAGDGGGRHTLFWKTGVCGGFTTFSTFSLEALGLFENGRAPLACLYAGASLVLCVLGVWLGRRLALLLK